MKDKIYKIVSTLLIVGGIIVIFYPKFQEQQQMQEQQQLLDIWQEQLISIDQGEKEEGPIEELTSQNTSKNVDIENHIIQEGEQEESERVEQIEKEVERARQREAYIQEKMEGVLEIKTIDLYLPILRGATEKNLNISLASLNNEGEAISDVNHYIIAGHRSHTFGKNFNRLDEVVQGDTIYLHSLDITYTYRVVEKLYVLPEDVYVLEDFYKEQKEITLITCDPMIDPTHRLIIKGILIE